VIVRLLLRLIGGAVIAGVAAALPQVGGGPVAVGYLVFLGALVALELVRAASRGHAGGAGSAFERALRRTPARAGRPDDLSRLEDQVTLATVAALDVHRRLRPALREVAAYRLRVRHGVELDADPQRASALLGAETWELVRPGLAPPANRFAPGLSPARLGRVLDSIEAL